MNVSAEAPYLMPVTVSSEVIGDVPAKTETIRIPSRPDSVTPTACDHDRVDGHEVNCDVQGVAELAEPKNIGEAPRTFTELTRRDERRNIGRINVTEIRLPLLKSRASPSSGICAA